MIPALLFVLTSAVLVALLPPPEILALQAKLCWLYKPFWYTGGFYVTVNKTSVKGFPPFWAYVNHIDGIRLTIGPVQQWTLPEALKLAKEQYRNLVSPPAPPVTAAAPQPIHAAQIRLKDTNNYGLECSCGWQGKIQSEPGHLCKPETCPSCARLWKEWKEHALIEKLSEFPTPATMASGSYRLPKESD
jgi:hypothetical protein